MNEIAEHDQYGRLVEEIVGEIHRARTLAVSHSNALTDGWTHGILSDRLNAQLHLREGTAPSNFPATAPDADPAVLDRLATAPYRLDFLALQPGAKERQLENELVSRITDFLTHLGTGFAYLGRQYRIEVGDTEFFLDLLFYNTRLHRYIVFEIKAQPFRPGHVGQLSFYVTAVERQLRSDQDHPTIGVLLVPAKDRILVEYALASIDNPMTVATYTYSDLPSDVRTELPASDQFIELVEEITHPNDQPDESPN